MLVQFQNDDRTFQLMQNSWAAQLNPVLQNPANQSSILKNIVLVSGDNSVNHKLGRKLQGWKIVRQRSAATFYDKQDSNVRPELTLSLNASADVLVDIQVF